MYKLFFDKNIKCSENRARLTLGIIGIINIVFIFIQNELENSISILILQSLFALLLYKGSNIIRILFIASMVEEILFLLKFNFFISGTGFESTFVDKFYFKSLMVFCIMSLYSLAFSKDIKDYFSNSKFDVNLKYLIITGLKNRIKLIKRN